jgi:hypothetical protein
LVYRTWIKDTVGDMDSGFVCLHIKDLGWVV